MKFASIEDAFEKFIAVNLNKSPSVSSAWAKKRLSQLEKANFSKGVKSFSEATKYNLATKKCYTTLSRITSEEFISKPFLCLDQRTFFHDRAVLKIRNALEKKGWIAKWHSEGIIPFF